MEKFPDRMCLAVACGESGAACRPPVPSFTQLKEKMRACFARLHPQTFSAAELRLFLPSASAAVFCRRRFFSDIFLNRSEAASADDAATRKECT